MTTPLWCLVFVAFLPYLLAFTSSYFKMQQFGKIDNKNPRQQTARLEGIGARVAAAQANAWEALAVFGVVVIVAHLAHADPEASATAAMVYLATRIAHPVLYLANQATLRTLVFTVGLGCIARLIQLASAAG